MEEREDIGRALATEEQAALLEAAAKNWSPHIGLHPDRAYQCHALGPEIRTLQAGRIDFSNRTLRVSLSKSKSGTGRVNPDEYRLP